MRINPTTFLTPVGVLQFPNIIAPSVFKDKNTGAEKKLFGGTIIYPVSTTEEKKVLMPMLNFAAEICDERHGAGTFKSHDLAIKVLQNGAKKNYAGYGEGKVYIAINSNFKPTLSRWVDGQSVRIDKEDEEEVRKYFYGGALVRAVVTGYAYGGKGATDKKTGAPIAAGVSLGLKSFEFVAHGEPLSGPPSDEENMKDFASAPAPVVPALPNNAAAPAPAVENKAADTDDEDIPF